MFPGFEQMFAEVQKLTERLNALKAEVAQRTVTGTAGGGMIVATVNGALELTDVRIEPAAISDDVEMLQDLIVAAVNQALGQARKMKAEAFQSLAGGLPLGALGGLLGDQE